MLRPENSARVARVLTIAVLAALVPNRAALAASPHILAKPNNVMVNSKVALTGTGFPANTKLTVQECRATKWVVPQHPCDTNNTISVHTDGHGRFTSRFKVELCGGKRGPGPTSQTCYIGNPRPRGVDTVALVGAARVVVTYP